jgi:hypothetical protein
MRVGTTDPLRGFVGEAPMGPKVWVITTSQPNYWRACEGCLLDAMHPQGGRVCAKRTQCRIRGQYQPTEAHELRDVEMP